MGSKCGGSPCEKPPSDVSISRTKPKRKNLEIEDTGISEIDSLFESSKEILGNLIYESGKLRHELKKFQKMSWVKLLKGPTLEDAITSMLMIFSAGVEGNFAKIGLQMLRKSPFIRFKPDALRPEHQEIGYQWIILIRELDSCLPTMERFRLNINSQVDITKNVPEFLKSITSGFKPADQVKASNTAHKNIHKFKRAHKIIEDIIQFQRKLHEDIVKTVEILNQGKLSVITVLGIKAHTARVYEPKDIVLSFWPEQERVRHQ